MCARFILVLYRILTSCVNHKLYVRFRFCFSPFSVDFYYTFYTQRAMAGSYAYFTKAMLRLSPSDVMTRLWVFLYTQVAQTESSV